jgi:hypothetical protein
LTFRTKWTDPDFRKNPKTNHFCCLCHRDLKPGQKHRLIMVEEDKWEAVHSDDWGLARIEIEPGPQDRDRVWIMPVGMDCARKLGLEWSRDPQ